MVTPLALTSGLASTYGSNLSDFQADATNGFFKITQLYSGSSSWILHRQISGIVAGDVITIDKLKFEVGTKAADWTPAPEDVQDQIYGATTRISTAESNINQLNTNISLRVDSSTFTSYKTSNDSAVSSLTSRVSSAELKITDSAIVSTVRSSMQMDGMQYLRVAMVMLVEEI